MSAMEGFRNVRTELANLNKAAVELAAKIQQHIEELGA